MQGLDAIDRVSRSAGTERCVNAREVLIAVILLYALARSSEVLAADANPSLRDFGPRDLNPHVAVGVPEQFSVHGVPPELLQPAQEFSASEFRPRQRFGFVQAPRRIDDTQSLHTTTVWQRMKDYKSKDRVRLITLWESTGSSLSIQAGRHGEPSLQWTSSSLNRGGSTRGLLDHVIAGALGAAGLGFSQTHTPARPGAYTAVVPTPSLRRSSVAAATVQLP